MSRTAVRRVVALTALSGRAEAPAIARSGFQCLQRQQFSQAPRRRAEGDQEPPKSAPFKADSTFGLSSDKSSSSAPSPAKRPALSDLSAIFEEGQASKSSSRFPSPAGLSAYNNMSAQQRYEEPHHLHVFATKHNTHITVTRPNRDPIISMSAGNIGFKHSQRKHYDTAFQLASYVFGRMRDTGLLPQIKKLEVILRGFGQGREAVTKAILGVEGMPFRNKIVRVTDATRLKFGGTRSPRPKRL
ncbi:hypothetical protein V501_01148 [Pseudogymnoascus sp. VKM F-4519 (FW-2642)]|nr:hypothetical protein V501_01148 [Pseudogymnoascus sp. VKM F-4519 (FW-2642)]